MRAACSTCDGSQIAKQGRHNMSKELEKIVKTECWIGRTINKKLMDKLNKCLSANEPKAETKKDGE